MKSHVISGEVKGMSCAGCVKHVRTALLSVKGVREAEISLMDGRVSITTDVDGVTDDMLVKAVSDRGFELILDPVDETPQLNDHGDEHRAMTRLVVAVVLTIMMMVVGMGHESLAMTKSLSLCVIAVASLIIYAYCAQGYHVRAIKNLRHGVLTMDTLVSMSITVAFVYSLYEWISPTGSAPHLYFDVVGMITSFVLIGKYLETRAKVHTTDALKQLVALQPDHAIRVDESGDQKVSIATVKPGDVLRIRKGDRVPVDGVLMGSGSFDESSIYGEPLPVDHQEGDSISSGAILQSDAVCIRTERVGRESLMGRMIETVRQAQASRAPIQRLADKISSIFVPIIILLSIVTLVGWGVYGGASWYQALFFGISVMVIACPCALGLATPTAMTVAVGRASQQGLLIRDAASLEYMSQVTDVIFDKTGTLTEGTPRVSRRLWLGERDEYRALLSVAEQRSSHPLAQALVNDLGEVHPQTVSIDDLKEIEGRGLTFASKGIEYVVGNRDFAYRAPKDPKHVELVQSFEQKHHDATLIYYSRHGSLLAIFVIEDMVRSDADKVIRSLRQHCGVQVHLLSGDRKERAMAVAEEAGIEQVQGGLSPIDKRDYIKDLQGHGRVIAMIGDGINDSPALAQADVSMAMGTGSAIVNDVAMITIVGNRLDKVEEVMRLSRATIRVIRFNYFWALIYNLVALPLAAGLFYPHLYVSPMWASALMAMSSLCVVLNSLRLKRMTI